MPKRNSRVAMGAAPAPQESPASHLPDLSTMMEQGLTIQANGAGDAGSSAGSVGCGSQMGDSAANRLLAIEPIPDGRTCITCGVLMRPPRSLTRKATDMVEGDR